MRRRRSNAAALGATVAAALVVAALLGGLGIGPSAADDAGVTVTAAPKWGEVRPGFWAPYSVVVRNDGGTDVEGEVVLIPQPEPAPEPGARPSTTTTTPTATTLLALGGRTITSPAPKGRGASTERPPWPTYRAPVSAAIGTEKTLTVMVHEAPFGYRVELRTGSGRTVARSSGPVPVNKDRTPVLLLSDVAGAEATLEALPQLAAGGLDVVQVRSARDLPDTALHLAGLDAVMIDDFGTATLSAAQRRALQDYVSFGGGLVVTGGAAWPRTLETLPAGLVPLRVSASADASLGPLAEMAAGTTTATATVAIGEFTAGRAMVGGPGRPPLVVESEYGAGRVVQLTYDPLAEPFRSDVALQGPAFDQALSRRSPHWGSSSAGGGIPIRVAEEHLWAPSLQTSAWPSWPAAGLGLAGLYALVVGPAAFVLGRRRRPLVTWVALPLAAVLKVLRHPGRPVRPAWPRGREPSPTPSVGHGYDGRV